MMNISVGVWRPWCVRAPCVRAPLAYPVTPFTRAARLDSTLKPRVPTHSVPNVQLCHVTRFVCLHALPGLCPGKDEDQRSEVHRINASSNLGAGGARDHARCAITPGARAHQGREHAEGASTLERTTSMHECTLNRHMKSSSHDYNTDEVPVPFSGTQV